MNQLSRIDLVCLGFFYLFSNVIASCIKSGRSWPPGAATLGLVISCALISELFLTQTEPHVHREFMLIRIAF